MHHYYFLSARFWRYALVPALLLAVAITIGRLAHGPHILHVYFIFSLWPASLLTAMLIARMDRENALGMRFSWAALILSSALFLVYGYAQFGRLGKPEALAASAIIAAFFIMVPLREFLARARKHRLALFLVLLGIFVPYAEKYVGPWLWQWGMHINSWLMHHLHVWMGGHGSLEIEAHAGIVRAEFMGLRIIRECGAEHHMRFFLPIVCAMMLTGKKLPGWARVCATIMLSYPLILLVNALRIAGILRYSDWRLASGVPESALPVHTLHVTTGGMVYLTVGSIALWICYRLLRGKN